MYLNLNLNMNQTQKMIMTPKLQQAIAILQLSREELYAKVQEEMLSNPLVEVEEQSMTEDMRERELKNFVTSFTSYGNETYAVEKEVEEKESSIRREYDSLHDYLLHQLRCMTIDAFELQIGTRLILSINENGYLQEVVEEAAQPILSLIQSFDPPGIGGRNLEECLLIQYWRLEDQEDKKWAPVVVPIINEYLKDIAERKYKKISKALNVSLKDIEQAAGIIKRLNPKPGIEFAGHNNKVEYITPDLIVREIDGDFTVLSDQKNYPCLKISSYYKKILLKSNDADDQVCQYIRERLQSALWLVKSIEQRRLTIRRVMESIIGFQIEFFRKGPNALFPLTQREVAEDIKVHESTVSRAVSHKYVQTDWGIFELKYFFPGGFGTDDGGEISSERLKDYLKEIIAGENPLKPYSDRKIAELLSDKGINISRRTIAKYRDELNILSSNKRKRYLL